MELFIQILHIIRSKLLVILGAVFLLMLLQASNCKKDNGTSPQHTPTYTQQIGPDGGVITTPEGFKIMVPQGALSNVTDISITPLANANELLEYADLNASYYLGGMNLLPDGLQFIQPITVRIPLEESLMPNTQYSMYVFNEAKQGWKEETVTAVTDETGAYITAELSHFSEWGAFRFPPEYAIVSKIKEFMQNSASPTEACNKFVQWFIETVNPFNFRAMVKGCCYGIVGAEFDIGYKFGSVEDMFQTLVGTKPPESYPFTMYIYDDDWYVGGQQNIINMNIRLLLGCKPELIITSLEDKIEIGQEVVINAFLRCGDEFMEGKTIKLDVDDHGTLNETEIKTDALGMASAKFKATSNGVAKITGKFESCTCESIPTEVTEQTTVEVGALEKWQCTLEGEISDILPPEYYFGSTCYEYSGFSWEYCYKWKSFECTFHLDFDITFDPNGSTATGTGVFNYDSYNFEVINDILYLNPEGNVKVNCTEPVYTEVENVPGNIYVIQKINEPDKYSVSFHPEIEYIVGNSVLSGPFVVTVEETYPDYYDEYSFEWDEVSREDAMLLSPYLGADVQFQEDDFVFEVSGIKNNFHEINCYYFQYKFTFHRVN
nr:hypothetical protein [Bacteroidota bacterium]